MKAFALFLAALILIALTSLFWIRHYEVVRTENKAWKAEKVKMIGEMAGLRTDAAEARNERNKYIIDYNRLRGIR